VIVCTGGQCKSFEKVRVTLVKRHFHEAVVSVQSDVRGRSKAWVTGEETSTPVISARENNPNDNGVTRGVVSSTDLEAASHVCVVTRVLFIETTGL